MRLKEYFKATDDVTPATSINMESEPTVCDNDVEETIEVHFPFKERSRFVPPSKRSSSTDTLVPTGEQRY